MGISLMHFLNFDLVFLLYLLFLSPYFRQGLFFCFALLVLFYRYSLYRACLVVTVRLRPLNKKQAFKDNVAWECTDGQTIIINHLHLVIVLLNWYHSHSVCIYVLALVLVKLFFFPWIWGCYTLMLRCVFKFSDKVFGPDCVNVMVYGGVKDVALCALSL